MLYSLMLGDLDEQAANDLGVLLYVKTGQMMAVPAMQMDKRGKFEETRPYWLLTRRYYQW